jgi:hypothetical protein
VLAAEAASFDRMSATWGTIGWLPDIRRWADVVAHFLKPGASLSFADAYPLVLVFDALVPGAGSASPRPLVPYLGRAPRLFDDPTDYADPTARLANSRTVAWPHPLGDILAGLASANLRLDWLREHPDVTWQMFRSVVRGDNGLRSWPAEHWLPLPFPLRATRVG